MNLKKKFVIGAASVALVAGMGGVAAPAAVATDIANPGFVNKLVRLGGMDRVSTSLQVAAYEFGSRVETTDPRGARPEVLYVTSYADGNLVDAASAGMLTDGPIAFVSNNSYVAEAVGKFFADTKTNSGFAAIKKVVAIGGEGAVSDATLKAVAKQLGANVATGRLGGKDRYETSVAIAEHIYSQALLKDNFYEDRAGDRITNLATSNLIRAYLANGADSHVVDSMVAGTLDNGAILLTQPDGKIPESVAEFIKKALPTQFSALGGTGAVADATVNEAWVIKALGNKWETSYSIPNLRDKIDELEKLIKGAEGKTGTKMSDEATFGGLKFVVEKASANNQSWQNAVTNEKLQISNWFTKNRGKTSADAFSVLEANLENLFGPGIVTSDPKFFKLDSNKNATGVDYDAITATQAYKDAVKAAEDELDRVWADKHQGTIANPIAVASQEHKTDVPAVTNQFAQIAEVAEYTLDNDKKWLDASEKQLASLKGEWRSEYDKIAPKTVQRFGGADRFETAQLIANWYAKGRHVSEAYIANGTRLADSLAAGQLMGGPILLVRNDTKIPEFTANVATHLLCWTDKTHPISVYGVGGTGVVSDDVLSTMVNLIGTKSVCEVKAPKATTSKLSYTHVKPNVVSGSQDGEAIVTWDKLTAADLTVADTKCEVALENVQTAGAKCEINNGKITVDKGANLADSTKPGMITVKVTYRDDTIQVPFTVYAGASEQPVAANATADKAKPDTQTKDTAFTNANDKQKMDKQGKITKCEWTPQGGSATEVACSAWGVAILDGGANDDKIRVVVPAQTAEGKLEVTVENTEPGKAPTTGTHTVTVS